MYNIYIQYIGLPARARGGLAARRHYFVLRITLAANKPIAEHLLPYNDQKHYEELRSLNYNHCLNYRQDYNFTYRYKALLTTGFSFRSFYHKENKICINGLALLSSFGKTSWLFLKKVRYGGNLHMNRFRKMVGGASETPIGAFATINLFNAMPGQAAFQPVNFSWHYREKISDMLGRNIGRSTVVMESAYRDYMLDTNTNVRAVDGGSGLGWFVFCNRGVEISAAFSGSLDDRGVVNWLSGGFFPLGEEHNLPRDEAEEAFDDFRGLAFKFSRWGFSFSSATYLEARRKFLGSIIRRRMHSLSNVSWTEQFLLGKHLAKKSKTSKLPVSFEWFRKNFDRFSDRGGCAKNALTRKLTASVGFLPNLYLGGAARAKQRREFLKRRLPFLKLFRHAAGQFKAIDAGAAALTASKLANYGALRRVKKAKRIRMLNKLSWCYPSGFLGKTGGRRKK